MAEQYPKGIQTNWCVITGAPSSGKTTLIHELDRQGYTVLHEAARIYIEAEIEKGRTVQELREDERAFQRGIFDAKLIAEAALDPAELVFLDRAVPETVTYYKLAGLDTVELMEQSRTYEYRMVFVLDGLDFEQDGVRLENAEDSAFLDREFECDYRAFGFRVVRVPVMSVEDRLAFIFAALAGA